MEACSKAVKLKISDNQGRIAWDKMKKKEKAKTKASMCNFYRERANTVAIGKKSYANRIW